MKQKYKNNQENFSFKPIAIGGILILIVIGLFISKQFLFKKNNEKIEENITEETIDEEINIPMILPEDLQKLIHKNTHQIIDIRDSASFEYNHIENSKNIPIGLLKEKVQSLNKNKPIIIVDQTETISGKEATEYLNNLDFSVRYLVGGIENFAQEGYSTISVGDPNSITDIAKVNPVSPEEIIKEILKESEKTKFLDVRPRNQFEKYKIEGSINIPLDDIEKRKSEIPIGKLIIVDEDPIRSFQAAVRLYDMNYIEVYCLKTSLSEFRKYVEESESEETENSSEENKSESENEDINDQTTSQ